VSIKSELMSPATRYPSHSTEVPASLPSFVLPVSSKSYAQQYANLYYLRLIQLRPSLLNAASKLWKDLPSKPKLVNKVLDVQGGRLCWIVGTVYMDMNMKPNILADLAREVSRRPFPKLLFETRLIQTRFRSWSNSTTLQLLHREESSSVMPMK
jgi:hypothetical protein